MASDNVEQVDQHIRGGIPGMRGVDHIALAVPDPEEATQFFVDGLGCEVYYLIGQFPSWKAL